MGSNPTLSATVWQSSNRQEPEQGIVGFFGLKLIFLRLIQQMAAFCGEMSERLKEHDWKSCVRPKGVSRVRIPLSPPFSPGG